MGDSYNFTGMGIYFFLYTTSANETLATTLLGKYAVQYTSGTSLQSNITEFRCQASQPVRDQIFNDILTTGLQVYYSEGRLPISGSLGSTPITLSAADIKTGSTDNTSGNAAYLKVDSSQRVIPAPPSSVINTTKTVKNAAEAIASSTACREVEVMNDPANASLAGSATILVGSSASQSWPIGPGQVKKFSIANLASIYAKTQLGTDPETYVLIISGSA